MVDIEPLELTLWLVAVEKLARRFTEPRDNELESLLRHSFHLLQLTPREFREALQPALPEQAFEKLLQEGAFEEAAKALVGSPATFSLSWLSPELFQARVFLAAGCKTAVAQAAEPAAALLRAWTQCVMALEDQTTRPQSENLHPAPSKAQSGPHLRLIEH